MNHIRDVTKKVYEMATATRITVIPPTAFGLTSAQLTAWEQQNGGGSMAIEIVRGKCHARPGERQTYAGYLLPAELTNSMFIAGWLAGRRSKG